MTLFLSIRICIIKFLLLLFFLKIVCQPYKTQKINHTHFTRHQTSSILCHQDCYQTQHKDYVRLFEYFQLILIFACLK